MVGFYNREGVFTARYELNLLNIIQVNRNLERPWTAQAVSLRSYTTEAWVRSQAIPCEICGGQSGTVTGFDPSTSALSCQYHSINATYSSSCSYQRERRAKPGKLPKR